MAKSIKKNFIFNLIYHLVTLFAPLIVTPYVSRVLGVDNIGQYSYAGSIVSYFTLVAVLGTSTFGQRNIGYVQSDKEERSRTFWEVFILRAMTSTVTLAGYMVFAFCFAPQSERIIFLILALNILNVVLDITWFMQGMEEFVKTTMRSMLFKILSIVFTFVFVKTADDLWIYVLITAGCSVLGSLSLVPFVVKNICRVRGIKPFRDIKTVLQLFIPTITTQVYTVLDKSMIGWFSDGYAENGYYEQSEKIIKIALTVVTALGTVMIPRIARLYKENDKENILRYMYKSYRFVWMIAIPLMIGIAAVSDTFVPVFFGAGYDKCKILIPIFSVLTVFIGLSNVTGIQLFVPTGRQNVLTLTIVVGAVVNVILNLILIPFYGAIGASIASISAEFCVTATGFIIIRKTREFALKPIFACSWKYWVCGIVMGGAVLLENYFLSVGAWQLAVMIVTGIAVYSVMLLILRDSYTFELLRDFRGMFRRHAAAPVTVPVTAEGEGAPIVEETETAQTADELDTAPVAEEGFEEEQEVSDEEPTESESE